uniref:LIM zinc-binding domain-containing protein n=1 Tax=Fagus sylvatica TaxID=28930 RepID=A0A2N9G663_FAGSY
MPGCFHNHALSRERYKFPPRRNRGTTQKCKACEKTVYLVEQLTADSKVYHKACFRCHHCKGTLKLSNYSSFEGVLYCKPHFDQLLKKTGSLDKSFEGTPRIIRADRSANQVQANSKVSSLFGGTKEKCVACNKTVYPIEKVAVDGVSYHKSCFRCTHGGCVISPSNYVAHEHRLYCKHHHTQLFKQKGNFSQLGRNELVKVVADKNEQVKLVAEENEQVKVVALAENAAAE